MQEKYYSKFVPSLSEKQLLAPIDFHKPDKAKIIALARLDLLNLWKNQRKNRTIKACKEFLNIEDLEILKCEIDEAEEIYLPPKIEVKKEKLEKYNPAVKPLFKTSRERYEDLMKYGCTCNEDRIWLTAYKESKEYSGLSAEG